MAHGQNLKKILGKAYSSKDSSNYYFEQAKKLLKTDADYAEYYFCKNALNTNNKILDSAKHYGEKALERYRITNNKDQILFVYHNLGRCYNEAGQYDKAIYYRKTILENAEKENDLKWMISALINLSLSYHDFEDYKMGVEYGKKAVQFYDKHKDFTIKNKHLAINALAINYDDWNKPDFALKYHYQNIDFLKKTDSLKMYQTCNNIGNTLMKSKRFKEAKKWILRAVAVLKLNEKNPDIKPRFDYGLATYYSNLAKISFELNNFNEADDYFKLAEYYAKASKNAEKMRDLYNYKMEYAKKKNNLEETIEAQEQYINLRDSVFKVEKAKAIADIETKYETLKKDKQITQAKVSLLEQTNKNRSKSIIIWSLIAGLAALFIISFLVYRQQRIKVNLKEEELKLKDALNEIQTQNKLHEQRMSISRDLHDNVGSQLSFVLSSVENIKYQNRDKEIEMIDKLDNIGALAKSAITDLRDTVWALNSNNLSLDEFYDKVLMFIETAKSAHPEIDFKTQISNDILDIKVASFQGINLYRIIQESINNALKYSKCSEVSFSIINNNNSIIFKTTDNGIGYNEQKITNGNGIHNIKQRSKDIEADILITTKENNGVTVEIMMPKNKLINKES